MQNYGQKIRFFLSKTASTNVCFVILLCLVGPACAQNSSFGPFFSEELKSKKTLFDWANGNSAEEDAAPEVDRLVTDRPHFSEASSLVGLGRVQLETGYTIFRDTSAGTTTFTHSFPEPLLRAGIFAEWFEFRLAANYLLERTTTGGVSTNISGVDDLYLGAKLALFEQAGILPEVALFPQMRVPLGAAGLTDGQVLPGFNLAYSWKLNHWIELECNTQLNRRVDAASTLYTEAIQTINIEYELADRVGAFTEWFCFLPSGATVALPEYYLHGGFVFFPNNDIQLDIHAGVGLNEPAANLAFTGVGFSKRW